MGAASGRLRHLSVQGNRINRIAYDVRTPFPALTLLSLERNLINEVCEMSSLARAEPTQIGVPGANMHRVHRASQWASIDALDCFPALSELRLGGNPLMAAPASRTFKRWRAGGQSHHAHGPPALASAPLPPASQPPRMRVSSSSPTSAG